MRNRLIAVAAAIAVVVVLYVGFSAIAVNGGHAGKINEGPVQTFAGK